MNTLTSEIITVPSVLVVSFLVMIAIDIWKSRNRCPHCNGEGQIPPKSYRDKKSSYIRCPFCDGLGCSWEK